MAKFEDDGPPAEIDEKTIPAKWAVIAIVLVAVSMAAAAWFYWYFVGREIKARWGSQNAVTIARAPEVELWALADEGEAALGVLVGDELLPVIERRDLTERPPPGWTHVRTLLLRDAAYDFDDAEACAPRWDYALSFSDDERRVVVLLSTECPRARLADGAREILADGSIRTDRTLRPDDPAGMPLSTAPIAEGLREFLHEQFAADDELEDDELADEAEGARTENGQEE